MKPETTLNRTMNSVHESLERASETLDNCVFPGSYSAAAMRSRLDLMRELSTDEILEIGVSSEILEKCGVI